MKPEISSVHELTQPQFLKEAIYLNEVLQNLNKDNLASLMVINETLADKVKEKIDVWSKPSPGSAAALTFRGDIYSGLSATQWQKDDAIFAQQHLLILSGLYGLLRPFDEIKPYRLEMGYKLKLHHNLDLATFWEKRLANILDLHDTYINLTAKEYSKVIQYQLNKATVITPKFLTVNKKTNLPVFVTVHAKIARGSLANWLIKNKIDDPTKVTEYDQLNYKYQESLSTTSEPVFVCHEFGGLGLSVRLA